MFVHLGSGLFGLWFQTFWVCGLLDQANLHESRCLRCLHCCHGCHWNQTELKRQQPEAVPPQNKTLPFLDMIFLFFGYWWQWLQGLGFELRLRLRDEELPATPRRSNWGAGGGRMLTWHHWFPVDFIADFPVVSLRACKRPSPSYLAAPSSRSASEAE